MKVPLSWLKEHIDTPSSTKSIAESLTLLGLEVDAIAFSDLGFENIVVVVIEQADPLTHSLRKLTVFDGVQRFEVVSAAPNCRIGLKTALAKVGAKITQNGKEIVFQEKKIQNIVSQGALISHQEIGFSHSPYGIEGGVMEFDVRIPLGQDLRSLLAEPIFHLSLTPNLGHAASIRGVARELAASENRSLLPLPPIEKIEKKKCQIKIIIENAKLCPLYACCLIEGVTIAPSPEWLKKRLLDAGMQTVNNVVDATNYMMLELGVPLHAFDADTLDSNTLSIRRAKSQESITTLDGITRNLTEDQLVVGSENKAYALAGLMGSLDTEVKNSSTRLLLECAAFAPIAIRKSSKALALATQASYRFERGIDAELIPYVLERTAHLIAQLAGASSVSELQEKKFEDFTPKKITVNHGRVNQLLGTTLSLSEIEALLKRVHLFVHNVSLDSVTFLIPSYRHDLKEEIDLIEEIARIYGYHHLIKKEKPKYRKGKFVHSPAYLFEKKARESLLRLSLTEVVACDLIGEKQLDIIGEDWVPYSQRIHILNPCSLDYSILRFSLLPGLLEIAKTNLHYGIDSLSLFEIGRIHLRSGENFLEPTMIGLLLLGSQEVFWQKKSEEKDFYALKGYVAGFFDSLAVKDLTYQPASYSSLHPHRQAQIHIQDQVIGIMGEVHPRILEQIGIDQRLFFAECNLEGIAPFIPKSLKMHPLPLYPAMKRDCTLALDKKMPISEILALIRAQHSPLLESIRVIDLYQHESLPKNQVNVTIRLTYRSPDRTLSIKEVDEEHNRIMDQPKRLQVSI